MGLKNLLLLDADDKALNCIVIGDAAVRFVVYDGPFYSGGKFDGTTIIDPNPPAEPEEGPAPDAPDGLEVL